jgi:hypothetical protein
MVRRGVDVSKVVAELPFACFDQFVETSTGCSLFWAKLDDQDQTVSAAFRLVKMHLSQIPGTRQAVVACLKAL